MLVLIGRIEIKLYPPYYSSLAGYESVSWRKNDLQIRWTGPISEKKIRQAKQKAIGLRITK